MSTLIVCVGKLKEKPYREMADEYLKRLSRFGKYEEAEIPDLPEGAGSAALDEQVKTKEGEAILARIKPGDHVIALTIVFVIGGSLGLGKNVLERADEEMSMSRMTFPHQLARVMLLEQVYRAEMISAGARYHK